jgi:hypothetical protein
LHFPVTLFLGQNSYSKPALCKQPGKDLIDFFRQSPMAPLPIKAPLRQGIGRPVFFAGY